jgi:hypothetical protein
MLEKHPDRPMDHPSRSRRFQRNEQLKATSNLAGNAGLALLAAGLGRWFFGTLDRNAVLWLIDGVAILWVGLMLLTLLEAER